MRSDFEQESYKLREGKIAIYRRIFESVHLYIYIYMHLESAARLGSLNSAFHQVCALGVPEWRSVP
jgi:hypothetical protein